MTTVAAKGGEMVADTQCTGDYTLRVQKIFRLQDGGVVGADIIADIEVAAERCASGRLVEAQDAVAHPGSAVVGVVEVAGIVEGTGADLGDTVLDAGAVHDRAR